MKQKIIMGSAIGFFVYFVYLLIIIWNESKNYSSINLKGSILSSIVLSILMGFLFGCVLMLLGKLKRKEKNRTGQLVMLGVIISVMIMILIFSPFSVMLVLVGW